MLIRKLQYRNSQASIVEVGNQHGNGDKFPDFADLLYFLEQVALGTDWM
jgi:hypothetical protein